MYFLTASDYYWFTVVINFWKARKMWDRLTRILGWEGTNMLVLGTFFMAVVQAVLIFGFETCEMTPLMIRDLGGLYNSVSQRIMVRQLRRRPDGIWEYPPLVEAMWEAVLEEVEPYVLRRQNKASQYIVTRPILEICEEAV